MEVGFRGIFLTLTFALLCGAASSALAQSDEADDGSLIEPQIERVEFDEAEIDALDFEIAAYAGYLAVENFDTNLVTGFKIGYHMTEDFFVQASYGRSEVGRTSFEKLSGGPPLLSSDERELEYYVVGLGFNLFPGEAFFTDSTTVNTVFYLYGGVGNTDFAGDDRYTIAYALGYRALIADAFSVDVEMRNLLFDIDIFGEDESTNNLELTFALTLYL